MLEHRMDKLTQTEQDLLNLFAVSDASVPWSILRASCDADSAVLTKAVLTLLGRSLIREENEGPEPGYRFRHPLIKAVAHARAPRTMQRQAHRRLAAVWKESYVSRAAFHILASGDPDDEAVSARLLYETGKRHLFLQSYRTTAEYLEQTARLAEKERRRRPTICHGISNPLERDDDPLGSAAAGIAALKRSLLRRRR